MIGVVGRDRFLEFADYRQLAGAMNVYGEKYKANTVMIVTPDGRIKAVFRDGGFDWPPELEMETRYRIIGCKTSLREDVFEKNKKIRLELNNNIIFNNQFWFFEAKTPKLLDI